MGLQAGTRPVGTPGRCGFHRQSHELAYLRLRVASLLKDRKIAPGLRVLVVPGSHSVKRQAESQGLDRIFQDAGADWRQPGCSMCIAMNGDQLEPGQYAVSTSNRNFEGRQGKGGRTSLASPVIAAGNPARIGKDHRCEGADLMAEWTSLIARGMPLPVDNIDTDQIIPAHFSKTTSKSGLGSGLFADWRYQADGSPRPDFPVNDPRYSGAQILVAGDNFACGSSRRTCPLGAGRSRVSEP